MMSWYSSLAIFSTSIFGELAACEVAAAPGVVGDGALGVTDEAAMWLDGAAFTKVSSASEMPSLSPLRSDSILRAAASNHDGISTSPPPWRPPVRLVCTYSGAAVGARWTAPLPLLLLLLGS